MEPIPLFPQPLQDLPIIPGQAIKQLHLNITLQEATSGYDYILNNVSATFHLLDQPSLKTKSSPIENGVATITLNNHFPLDCPAKLELNLPPNSTITSLSYTPPEADSIPHPNHQIALQYYQSIKHLKSLDHLHNTTPLTQYIISDIATYLEPTLPEPPQYQQNLHHFKSLINLHKTTLLTSYICADIASYLQIDISETLNLFQNYPHMWTHLLEIYLKKPVLDLVDEAELSGLYVFAQNYNVLRIMSGMGGLRFAN